MSGVCVECVAPVCVECVALNWTCLMADPEFERFRAFRNPERNWRQTVYVYRLRRSGKSEKPYLFKSTGFFDSDSELIAYLRDEFGGGEYRILIRDGSTMVYSGEIGIERPMHA